MQRSQGAATKSAARQRPLRVLSGNRAPHRPPGSLRRKPAASPSPYPAAAAAAAAANTAAGPALDRLLLARSDLAGLVSQIDELVSSALQCQTISTRGEQEIASFSCFLSDTNSSLKQWSSRLKEALEASRDKSEDDLKHTVGTCSASAAKGNDKLFPDDSMLPHAGPAIMPSHNLVCTNSNLPEDDLIVSPSPLVSWRPGSCMVESGKQLFLLTPLPKTRACSSRCPSSSKTELKATAGMEELNLPNLPVWKLTISDDNRPDLEQSVEVKETRVGVATPHLTSAKKGSSEDSLFSPFSFSIQKSRRALPSPCLKTALPGKRHVFSPISEGSTKEDILSSGPTESHKPSGGSDDMLSDEKDLATRYPDLYGFNQPTANTCRRREADEALDWFLSPLKACVLMDSSPTDDKPIPTPARHDNKLEGRQELSDDSLIQTSAVHSKALIGTPWRGLENKSLKGGQGLPDDKPIQTPAVNSKALLGTPWKGLESTNLKGRHAGETTLKRELWTRFEAVSTNELHFDKSLFQKSNGTSFIDMLEDAS